MSTALHIWILKAGDGETLEEWTWAPAAVPRVGENIIVDSKHYRVVSVEYEREPAVSIHLEACINARVSVVRSRKR